MHSFNHCPVTFYRKAFACAHHYGFSPVSALIEEYDPPQPVKKFEKKAGSILDKKHKKIDVTTRDLEASLKQLAGAGITSFYRPFLFYTSNVDPEALADGSQKSIRFGLHIVGMKQSLAEAMILKTASTILEDLGVEDHYTYINSLGDRDSSQKFVRETTTYFRKYLHELPSQVRESFKEDVFLAYSQLAGKTDTLPAEAPRPMEYLSSASRRHLREVLEFLEAADLPYIFDDRVIGHRDCYQQTLFELRSNTDDTDGQEATLYARGGRYDELARQYFRTQTPAVGIVFTLTPEKIAKKSVANLPKPARRPRVFFIRLGYAAELKSFGIMETLRKARISATQNLGSIPLSEQLTYAERVSIPYTVIMGQKEALENSVIIRDTSTRAQQTIPVATLSEFFKTAS